MENLYKLNEYPGILPNPRQFPIQGVDILSIENRPNAFSDGYIVDLYATKSDKLRLGSKVARGISFLCLGDVVKSAKQSEVLLSEPEFIYDTTNLSYILFTPDGNPVAIQVKYYKYFRNRYKDCQFYSRGLNMSDIIAIRANNKLIGVCMPVILDKVSILKIKEERE